MAFYENTLIVAKQDLAEKDLKNLKDKYNELLIIHQEKLKIEEWGLIKFSNQNKKL